MAISLVVVSATPRATNSVSAARSTPAFVSSAFPIPPLPAASAVRSCSGGVSLGGSMALVRAGVAAGQGWPAVGASCDPPPLAHPDLEAFDQLQGHAPNIPRKKCTLAAEHAEPPQNEYL